MSAVVCEPSTMTPLGHILADDVTHPGVLDCGLTTGLVSLSGPEYSALVRQDLVQNFYHVDEEPISSGQWASVYKCRLQSSGTEFVAKFCNKHRLGVDSSVEIVHEMAVLYQCRNCPRIVRLHEVFETDQQYILIMEYGKGGDLQSILDDNQVPYERDVIRFVRNLLEGLVFLHGKNIAHLDIKPQNVVLTCVFPDCEVKLCDLEISRHILARDEVREMLGTPDYVAPEILRFEPVSLQADIWSVGVLVYVLLTGFTPFGGDSDAETFRNIAQAVVDFPEELFEDVSENAKDWIAQCLVLESSSRPSARQLLTHPWLLPQPCQPPSTAVSEFGSSLSIISNGTESVESSLTLRRSVSKSREVLFERARHGNLKKYLSKSRERLCGLDKAGTGLRFSLSRSSEVINSRPPWRTAGVSRPLGSVDTTPTERVNSFKVRDEYQNQVAASISCLHSINNINNNNNSSSKDNISTCHNTTPFVRQCSLRGRRKSLCEERDTSNIYSSMRRGKNSKDRDKAPAENSSDSKLDDAEYIKQCIEHEEPHNETAPVRPDRRRQIRKDSTCHMNSPSKSMIVVEIENGDENTDVFTRLYKESLKDPDIKTRKLRDHTNEDDGASGNFKPNVYSGKPKKEVSRSPESTGRIPEAYIPGQHRRSRSRTPTSFSSFIKPDDEHKTAISSNSISNVEEGKLLRSNGVHHSGNSAHKTQSLFQKNRADQATDDANNLPFTSDAFNSPVSDCSPHQLLQNNSMRPITATTADKSTLTEPFLLTTLIKDCLLWQQTQDSERFPGTYSTSLIHQSVHAEESSSDVSEEHIAHVSILRNMFERQSTPSETGERSSGPRSLEQTAQSEVLKSSASEGSCVSGSDLSTDSHISTHSGLGTRIKRSMQSSNSHETRKLIAGERTEVVSTKLCAQETSCRKCSVSGKAEYGHSTSTHNVSCSTDDIVWHPCYGNNSTATNRLVYPHQHIAAETDSDLTLLRASEAHSSRLCEVAPRIRSHSDTSDLASDDAAHPWRPMCSGAVARAVQLFGGSGEVNQRRQSASSSRSTAAMEYLIEDVSRPEPNR